MVSAAARLTREPRIRSRYVSGGCGTLTICPSGSSIGCVCASMMGPSYTNSNHMTQLRYEYRKLGSCYCYAMCGQLGDDLVRVVRRDHRADAAAERADDERGALRRPFRIVVVPVHQVAAAPDPPLVHDPRRPHRHLLDLRV